MWIGEGAEVDRDAILKGPLCIGDYAKVEAGAELREYTVVGSNTVVRAEAFAHRSVLHGNVFLGRGANLRGTVIGKNTVECMQSGAVFGFAGMVDGLVRRVCAEVPGFGADDVAVIGTGDSAPLIMPESRTLEHHEPDLTLEGLRLVFERNQVRRATRATGSTGRGSV